MKRMIMVFLTAAVLSACGNESTTTSDTEMRSDSTNTSGAGSGGAQPGTNIETGTGGATSRPSGDTTGTEKTGITGANGNYDATSGSAPGVTSARDSLNSYAGTKRAGDSINSQGGSKKQIRKDSGRRQ